jgi:hypothetical protein
MKDLPSDLAAYLERPNLPSFSMTEGEVRTAELLPLAELQCAAYHIKSDSDEDDGGEEGVEFMGYSLLKSAGAYDPDGVLAWFPELGEYGAWDCDHHTMITFPGVTWPDIAADPIWYINGQWYPERVKHRVITSKDKEG